MAQQLSLSARPKTLDALVGQTKLVEAIRGHATTGRLPKAWMFAGPTGCGKTSIARILAVSYMCKHQAVFGSPCKECYRDRARFSIQEINAATIGGKSEVKEAFQGSEYGSLFDGEYRVYILDECHRLSDAAQSMCLDFLENTPPTAIFILCTTDPQKVKDTLRGRCLCYELKELAMDDVTILVRRLLKLAKNNQPVDRLVDALGERGIRYPRLITQAVEKYVSGLSPEDAAQVEGMSEVDVKSLTKAVTKGDWEAASSVLLGAQANDMKSIRYSMLAYLRRVLLENPISDRNKAVASAITTLCSVENAEDSIIASAVCASVYSITSLFARYPL